MTGIWWVTRAAVKWYNSHFLVNFFTGRHQGPGGGEFDPHVLGVGNLNCTLDFM